MKKIQFLALLLLTGCAFEKEISFLAESPCFHAKVESASTKTVAQRSDDGIHILWNASDEISVFNRSTGNKQYRFTGTDAAASGDFKQVAILPEGTYDALSYNLAVYPYNPDYTILKDGEISLVFPSSQVYREDNYDPAAAILLACSENENLHFLQAVSYLGIQLFGREASVKSLTLTACGGEAISGPASIKLDNLKKPGDVQWNFQTTGSSSSITLTMESPVRLAETESTTFWFCLPPVTLSQGFTIDITEADGAQTSITSNKALSLSRGMSYRMKPVSSNGQPGLHFAGGSARLFDPATDQYGIYTAEGKVWLRLVNPSELVMYQLGPVPVDAKVGDVVNVLLEEFHWMAPQRNTSSPYSLRVKSIEDRYITLVAEDNSYFMFRF